VQDCRFFGMPTSIADELNRRENLWTAVRASGGPDAVPPDLLRNLNIYSGARGIYTDAETTGGLARNGGAVTVSLLHTGKVYADELSADGVVYHYPETQQPGKDAQEIRATKAAADLRVPVFVITTSANPASRDLRLGWVVGWDDPSKVFLVTFADSPAPLLGASETIDERAFHLTSSAPVTSTMVPSRPGQARFKFEVFRRYGAVCAVCNLAVDGLLDAAHIRDKRFNGSDDPRNGLVLCALHHRALDRGLFGIRAGDRTLHALPKARL
jgi:putative restriction endonuclease